MAEKRAKPRKSATKSRARPPRNAAGRFVTTYSEEAGQRVVEGIRRGLYRRPACALAGVAYDSCNDWLEKGRAGQEPYAQFWADYQRADAEAEDAWRRKLDEAAQADPSNWKAIAWLMSKRWPKRYGDQPRRHDVSVTAAVATIDVSRATTAQLERIAAARGDHAALSAALAAVAAEQAALPQAGVVEVAAEPAGASTGALEAEDEGSE